MPPLPTLASLTCLPVGRIDALRPLFVPGVRYLVVSPSGLVEALTDGNAPDVARRAGEAVEAFGRVDYRALVDEACERVYAAMRHIKPILPPLAVPSEGPCGG